jgi:CRISPR-associated protein Cmr4
MANTQVYWLHALSPTHVGTGRGVGYIDLPIHRDKVTNWPVIPGSAFKGVWRDWAQRAKLQDIDLAFGRASDRDANAANSGALIPTDARLVCLPVRSFQGTFAWCASPMTLQMLHRDLTLSGMTQLPEPPPTLNDQAIHRATTTVLEDNGRIFLEDLDFKGQSCPKASEWADSLAKWVFHGDDRESWRGRFIERFAVVPDTIFDFLTETCTEVTSRVKIDDDLKTVANGQLWNEESLPAETILFGLISCDRIFSGNAERVAPKELLSRFASDPLTLQIGGKATIGRGRVRCVFTPVGD